MFESQGKIVVLKIPLRSRFKNNFNRVTASIVECLRAQGEWWISNVRLRVGSRIILIVVLKSPLRSSFKNNFNRGFKKSA